MYGEYVPKKISGGLIKQRLDSKITETMKNKNPFTSSNKQKDA